MMGMLKGLKWLVLLLLLVVMSAYGIARSGSKPLDQTARDQLGGDYLQTAEGALSYTRQGPAEAPVVILVHGFSTPLLGEWLATVFGKQYVRGVIKSDIAAGLAPADMLDKFDQQAAYSGYTDALLSTLRHFPMANLADRYRIVGETDIPVTAIWGTADNIVPYEGAALMAEDVGQLKLITLPDGGHNIAYARAEEVAAAMVSALRH